ncbi:MAG: DNA polymerase III subunit delta [Planctomycetales bacterium 4484_123]|nr:MAG: DNA polymerase III subunit delta [Planctomycetales bacterium 4484_123]
MAEKPCKCIYIFNGPDPYLRRHYRRQLIEALPPDEHTALAVTDLDGQAQLATVLDELRTAPLLAARRMVFVHDADPFVSRYRHQLEDYLDHPCPTGTLVLMVNAWQGRWVLARKAAKVGEVFDCSCPAYDALPGWISKLARARGKTISREAAEVLAEWIGPDLARLDSELEKLALFVGRRSTVSADDVAAAVVATAGPEPFALTNAIEAGDLKGALEALDDLLSTRGDEFRALGLIGWMLRSSLQGRRRRPRSARRGRDQSPQRSFEDFRHLLEADLALKTGADPLTTMQLLVTRLCS